MKKNRWMITVLSLTLLMTGCASAMETDKANARSVNVIETKLELGSETLEYTGVVDSKEIVKYSFKTPGKIKEVFVEKGQKVKKGDVLAKLDEHELKFAISGSEAALKAAEFQVTQAKEAYNYDKDNLKKMKELLESDAISQDSYNQLTLKTKVSEENYKQALEQVKGLGADLEHKRFLLENATLVANTDGMVVEVLYKKNEHIAAGYPVVALRSVDQVVNVGLAQKDVDRVQVGNDARIDFYGDVSTGEITQIAEAPDMDTRTYNGEITLKDSAYRLGSITKVSFDIGQISGIWVPVNSVLSDGEDYVYTVKEGRAFKQIVKIVQIQDGKMMVEGLEENQLVVINGMKNLLDGMEVTVSEE
jgi:RND family efflux transporter MFP subunit